MNWVTKLFSAGASELVESVGNTIDKLVTSDEEKIRLKNAMKEKILSHNDKQMQHLANYDEEITKRHQTDMTSDSWLSKNIRPLTLIFMVISTMLLVYITTFTDLTTDQNNTLSSWVDMLTTLLTTMFAFYFGSRGIEKVSKNVFNGKKDK